jgi:hypothetical protein
MTNNISKKSKRIKDGSKWYLVILVGVLISGIGIWLVSVGIAWSRSLGINIESTSAELVKTIGSTMFAAGIIGIVLETRNWKSYFSERLREVVMEHDYLQGMKPEHLKALQVDVMKAFFKDADIDKEKSFLNYFHNHLHKFISEPYREDVSTELIVTEAGEGCYRCFDKVAYVCRAAAGKIQENVRWVEDKDEFAKLLNLKITAKKPGPDGGEPQSIVDLNEKQLAESRGADGCISVEEPLSKYEGMDGLCIVVQSEYLVKKHRFQYWQMAHPTRNLSFTIKYPEAFCIQYKQLVIDPSIGEITERPGYLKVKYDSWMLPMSGLAWKFRTAAEDAVLCDGNCPGEDACKNTPG